jgi:uncharacterized membrane protein YsdA (DUF1294 family)
MACPTKCAHEWRMLSTPSASLEVMICTVAAVYANDIVFAIKKQYKLSIRRNDWRIEQCRLAFQ